MNNIYEKYDKCFSIRQDLYSKNNYGATANLIVTRTVFKNIGNFPNVISSGDQAFCRIAIEKNVNFVYDSDLKLKHPARSTFRSL